MTGSVGDLIGTLIVVVLLLFMALVAVGFWRSGREYDSQPHLSKRRRLWALIRRGRR